MNKRKRHINNMDNTLYEVNRGVQKLVGNSEKISEKMDGLTEEVIKGNRRKTLEGPNFAVAVITAALTLVGVIVAIIGIKVSNNKSTEATSSDMADVATETEAYEIYLYPEYSRLKVGAETDITATLNFDTDSVRIDAYLDSVHDGDTLELERINSSEWGKRIEFQGVGTYEVIATATAPDGSIVEGTGEIEVVP